MERFPRVVVDLAALGHNLQVIRETAPDCRVMAVIKANAYGHGLVAVARALRDADALAVARIDEALTLRSAGVGNEIVLLEGVFSRAELDLAAQYQLTQVVHNFEQLAWLETYPGPQRLRCWLKVDTGMHRLGFTRAECANALQRISACKALRGQPGLMTHLASAELADDVLTGRQLEEFEALCRGASGDVSSANSAAVFLRPRTRIGWVRPGLALYGVSPLPGSTGSELGLQPAMRFETRLIAVKSLTAGDSVGYNSTWSAGSPTRMGIAAVGYGDGYLRSFCNGTPVLVAGERASIIGRVSMDMIAVDLGLRSDAKVGDQVLLWGPELPVESLAESAGTIAYELLCNVSARVHAEYVLSPPRMA